MRTKTVQVGIMRYIIILFVLATAAIHLMLAFRFPEGPDPLFVLNGLGYIILAAALYFPVDALAPYRRYLRWILLIYTAITLAAWLLIGARTPIAYLDKAIEVALIILLWLDSQQRLEVT